VVDGFGEGVRSPSSVTEPTAGLTREEDSDVIEVVQRYARLVEPGGSGILVLNAENRVTFANAAMARMLGCAVGELSGLPVSRFIDEGWRAIAAARWRQRRLGVAETYDLKLQRRDGTELWAMVSPTPAFGEGGLYTGAACLVIDVTDRKRAEDALKESEARFRRLSESPKIYVFRYETYPANSCSYISPTVTQIIGYSPEEFYADPSLPQRLVHPEDLPTVQALRSERVQDCTLTFRMLHRDGRTVWVEQRNVSVLDSTGREIAVEGIIRDVTAQKELEVQLQRAQRLETAGKIAGQVAHDLNNLLGPFLAFPEMIKSLVPNDKRIAEYCDTMVQAAERMMDISTDLLVLGSRGNLERQPTELNQLVKEALGHLITSPDTLVVDLQLAGDLMSVNGAPSQLLRVLENLIVNAREAMQDLGTLTIRTENVYLEQPVSGYSRVEVGEYVRVIVADTGGGIPRDVRDRVFDDFFTTKRARRRGSGLGLTVVQSIIGDHKGYVALESEHGKGTAFSVYLPACQKALAQVGKAKPRGGSESLLIVDDDVLQQKVLKAILEPLGYQVRVASSGEEALGMLQDQPADLLILGMMMRSGIDGAETYRRALRIHPGQKATILSGFAETEQVAEAQSLGAIGFLRKPINLARLAVAVREELDRPC